MMQLRQEELTWQIVGDDVVVLDLGGSMYLKLNGSGRVLWEALAGPSSQDDLIERLVDRYAIDRNRAAVDVAGFVANLRARGLLAQ